MVSAPPGIRDTSIIHQIRVGSCEMAAGIRLKICDSEKSADKYMYSYTSFKILPSDFCYGFLIKIFN